MTRALPVLTWASLVVALVLMLLFEDTVTRVVGVAAIFSFIVSGVFLIATPEFLALEDGEHEGGSRRRA